MIRDPSRRRGFQAYLLIGLLLGIGLGIWIAWKVVPVSYTDVAPSGLSSEAKDEYRLLVARAYQATGNLNRGKARLALLEEGDSAQALAEQAQRLVASGTAIENARTLALMAAALSSGPGSGRELFETPQPTATLQNPLVESPTPPEAPTETPAEMATETPAEIPATEIPATEIPLFPPTPTATPLPYGLLESKSICSKAYLVSQIMVEVLNQEGQPVPGEEITVTWPDGEDTFLTGMKPDIDPGYADFTMEPNVLYTLRIANSQQPLTDLKAPACTSDSGKPFWGSILVTYRQPAK